MTAIPALFAGLCDDAAMFPPGSAAAEDALPAHRRYREAWFAPLVGPFLIGTARLPPVAEAVRHGAPLPQSVVLVVPGGPGQLAESLDAAGAGLVVVGVELAAGSQAPAVQAVQSAVDALDRLLPPGAIGVVEVPPGGGAEREAVLDLLSGAPYRAKLRTGGTVAEAFPSAADLAHFVTGCTARQFPFKCTAGLHRAVRHTDPATGFEHHGFLNILAATAAALAGAGTVEVTDLLDQRDGHELAAGLGKLTESHISATRRAFTAFGTCSVREPLADLQALSLIPLPPTAPTEPA